MHIALHGGQKHCARGGRLLPTLLYVWLEYLHGALHGASCLDHLRQKHTAIGKEASHGCHALHQRPFDDIDGRGVFLESLGQVCLQVGGVALDERVDEAVRNVDN